MFNILGIVQRFKSRRRSSFCIQFAILFIVCSFLIYGMVMREHFFSPRKVVIQNDLLDYNDDELRPEWTFQMNKHYDVSKLRTYKQKPKIVTESNAPGEEGKPVVLPPELQELANSTFNEYGLNIVASNKVSNNRSLPDLRHPKCSSIKYPERLPSTSVIMVIHNEAWSILMRAVWSVLNRTPDELLEELILVDDFSDKPDLKEHLDEYIATQLPSKVKLIRTKKREGLIRARVIGAESAKGQVLAFLDGNIESNDGWLEPLLSRIASDRSVIAIPLIDDVDPTNMAYGTFRGGSSMFGFSWNLFFKSFPIPEHEIIRNHGDMSAPFRSPSVIGCAIIVDREFFFEIGTFDLGMDIWGGENTELSIRTWQCGGAIEIVPCSRMGHYFRTLPYSFNADKDAVITRNNMRTAKVWMDEYKPYFDVVTAPEYRHLDPGDLSKQFALRKQLKCKGFEWYLKNVFPESDMGIGFKAIGQIQALGTKYCLCRHGRPDNAQIGIDLCHGNSYLNFYGQGFAYQNNNQIIMHNLTCLSLAKPEQPIGSNMDADQFADPNNLFSGINTTNHVVFLKCSPTNGTKWKYDENENRIIHIDSGLCLSNHSGMAIVAPCKPNDSSQKWIINSYEG